MRIHITGASGSGTTTLGEALAQDLSCLHLDTDNFFWQPTKPPFKQKRHPIERVTLLRRELEAHLNVVLSGSIVGWGNDIEDSFELIVFLYLPCNVRIDRLRRREIRRYGVANPAFLEWASQYDEGPPEGRSLAKHNAWLARRACPVLRLEEDHSVEQRLSQVHQAIARVKPPSAA